MMTSSKIPMVRNLRGGRRAQFKDVRAKAAELAADIRGILSENPGYRDAEIDLQALSTTLQRLATRDAELPRSDPLRLLTAVQLGQDLQGLSDDMVRLREKDGALFSVLPAGRQRGRLYPAFQAWEGIVGEPLAHVLGLLRGLAADQHLAFFGRPNADLQMLTPIEVMLGQLLEPQDLSDAATSILHQGARRRLEHVAACADRFRQAVAGQV